jgi:hypothetical protein
MGISCREDFRRAVLLKQITASHNFDSGAGYRLLSLALMQAVAWLSEGSSTLSGERRDMFCVVMQLLPCGCTHKC